MTNEDVREIVVADRHHPADDVIALALADPSGTPLPDWDPGAHVDVLLPDDRIRQYSLCGWNGTWDIAVLNAPDGRGGSSWIHDNLHVGDTVRIRGPRNNFGLVSAQRYIFIAGGIGITPIIAMVRELAARGHVDWTLTYGGRTRSSMAFVTELEAMGHHVDVVPQDERGLIDVDAALGTPQIGTAVYCCGPEPLLKAVERASRSWPPGTLHVERFTSAEVDTTGDQPFDVVAERSGITVTVYPGTSVLDALAEQGVFVATSCGEGVCGTCATTVLDGEVEHRDAVLSEEERAANTVMMVCCSGARGPKIVLDI
jgi:ferredoxin-NADP reductase